MSVFRRLIRKDGQIRHLTVTRGEILWDGEVQFEVVYRDITEQKQAEQELLLQSQLLDSQMDGVIVHDLNGNIIYANQAACVSHGYTNEELLQMKILDLTSQDSGKMFQYRIKELREKGQASFEVTHIGKDGSIMPLEIHTHLTEWSGQKLILSVQRNISERKEAERQLNESYKRLQQSFLGVTKTISAALEMRDPYTAGHQGRVANLAKRIAKEMNLSDEHADQIYTAALLHDIGKIGIPAEILSKPGRLNNIEYSLIKMHPQAGYDILKNIEFPYPIARWVLEHHEKIDGSGYPEGLTGEKISLEAKILAVADVVEAISSHRPYRPSLGTSEALNEISKNKGVFYDSKVVEACVRLFYEKGFNLD